MQIGNICRLLRKTRYIYCKCKRFKYQVCVWHKYEPRGLVAAHTTQEALGITVDDSKPSRVGDEPSFTITEAKKR